jgi:hypothetical protein
MQFVRALADCVSTSAMLHSEDHDHEALHGLVSLTRTIVPCSCKAPSHPPLFFWAQLRSSLGTDIVRAFIRRVRKDTWNHHILDSLSSCRYKKVTRLVPALIMPNRIDP